MYTLDIDYVKHLKNNINDINKQDINDIVFTKDGKVVEINKKILESWAYIGLNNIEFITSEYYKNGVI